MFALVLNNFNGTEAKLSWDITTTQVNSALHPSGVAKSSISFGLGKGWKVSTAEWQVTLCDPIWHVISRSREMISTTNCYIWFTLLTMTREPYQYWSTRYAVRLTVCTSWKQTLLYTCSSSISNGVILDILVIWQEHGIVSEMIQHMILLLEYCATKGFKQKAQCFAFSACC